MYEGRIVGRLSAAEADPERLGLLMAGWARAGRVIAGSARVPAGAGALVRPDPRAGRGRRHGRRHGRFRPRRGRQPARRLRRLHRRSAHVPLHGLEVLVAATPLLLTGAAVAIAFRAGFWNIGAEGQLLAGAIAAAWTGTHVGGVPRPLAIAAMAVAGAIGGAVWVLAPALMRAPRHRRGRHDPAPQPGCAAPRDRPAQRPVAQPGDEVPGVGADLGERRVPAAPLRLARPPRLRARAGAHRGRLVRACADGDGAPAARSGSIPRRPGSPGSASRGCCRRTALVSGATAGMARERGSRDQPAISRPRVSARASATRGSSSPRSAR